MPADFVATLIVGFFALGLIFLLWAVIKRLLFLVGVVTLILWLGGDIKFGNFYIGYGEKCVAPSTSDLSQPLSK